MRPDEKTRRRWIEEYNAAPKTSRRAELRPAGYPDSFSLLDRIQYTPSERDQGYCGDCWAWAGTGVLEVALDVQTGHKDRLSVQYLNSNYNGGSGPGFACCGGWLSDFAEFYASKGLAIPWSNTNGAWSDGGRQCSQSTSVPASSISTSPNYRINSITATAIPTHGVEPATAISNIKDALIQNKAVWFGFFMPTASDGDEFASYPSGFWWSTGEDAVWNPDPYSGHTWNNGWGHAVVVVGYDDSNPSNQYWIILNSWGTADGGRPNGLFRMKMDIDYDDYYYDPYPNGYYSLYFQTLDVSVSSGSASTVTFYTNPTSFVGASSPGSITSITCGGTFTNGQSNSTSCGSSFTATANLPVPITDWQFHHWEWSGGVSCSSDAANPASCTITGSGSLKAVYSAKVTFQTDPTNAGSISWGSCSNSPHANGQTVYDVSLPPEYANNSITACYVPSGYTLSGWSCTGGLSCSGSNDPVRITFTGPGTVTAAFKQGSLSNPMAASLTATTTPNPSPPSASFTVSGTLKAGGVGLEGKQVLLFFTWNFSLVSVTTQPDGSYSYTATAPSTPGTRRILVLYGGDLTGSPQHMPSLAITSITVQ